MDSILQLLQPYFANEAALRLVITGMAGITFALLGLGIAYLFLNAVDPVQRRLGDIRGSALGDESAGGGLTLRINTLLGPVSQHVLPSEELERSSMLKKLTHAGFREPTALQTFYSIKTVLSLGLPILAFLVTRFFPDLTTTEVLLYAIMAAGVGVLLPNLVLERFLNKRQKALRDGFPDALDLLVVCVEAGLGLSQAIQRVSGEMQVSHPELADELALVGAEVQAGVDRMTALKNLATRSGLDDIQGLVSLLVQTLRFGTSVANTLRVYSEEFRDKRMQKAEEQAAKIGTKLIFPLVLFLFPAFFVVAIGPAVMRIANVFSYLGDNIQ